MEQMKINNSASAAVKTGRWHNPGAKFYDRLSRCNDLSHIGNTKESHEKAEKEGKIKRWEDFIREAYLVVGNLVHGPHDECMTSYARSGCKYPHHVIKDGELVVSIPGLKAAYARAKQQGQFKGKLKEHLERHYKEMGIYEDSTMASDKKIEENFIDIMLNLGSKDQTLMEAFRPDIEDYFSEEHSMEEDYLCEKSQKRKLDKCFRLAYDISHRCYVKIVYRLNPDNITGIGPTHAKEKLDSPDYLDKVKNNITKDGHLDFQSVNDEVVAIININTNERYRTADTIGAYEPILKDFWVDNQLVSPGNNASENKISDMIRTIRRDHKDIINKITVGERDKSNTFKSTHFFKFKQDDFFGTQNFHFASMRNKMRAVESLSKGRGAKLNDVVGIPESEVGNSNPVKYKHPKRSELLVIANDTIEKTNKWYEIRSGGKKYEGNDLLYKELVTLRDKLKTKENITSEESEFILRQADILSNNIKKWEKIYAESVGENVKILSSKRSETSTDYRLYIDDNTPVTWCTINHANNWCGNVYCEPQYRRQGYTEYLLRSLLEQKLFDHITVETNNTPALNLYLKIGFVKEADWVDTDEDTGKKVNKIDLVYNGSTDESYETESMSVDELIEDGYISRDGKNLTIDVCKLIGHTPQAISFWMRTHMDYDTDVNNWKLRTPTETLIDCKGNCHDQSLFIALVLNGMGYDVGQLFFIEFFEGKQEGGTTHTLTWYREKDEKDIYWFENAWEDHAGIHGPYDDISDLKQAVFDTFKNDDNINTSNSDGLVFSTRSTFQPGMDLTDYVNHWILEDEHRFVISDRYELPEPADKYDPPMGHNEVLKRYGWEVYDKLVSDPVHKWRMDTGIELIHREPTREELIRICANWQAMSKDMKARSDSKSKEFFNMTNINHYIKLMREEYKIDEAMSWIDNFANDEVFREAVSKENNLTVALNTKTPQEFLRWMDNIEYGWIDKTGKEYKGDDWNENDFYRLYYLQPPVDLAKHGIGVCWDQTELERKWFSRHNYVFAVFYLELDDKRNNPSHTFVIYYSNGGYFWFEHSWAQYRGIHRYTTLPNALKDIIKKHQKQNKDYRSPVILRHMANIPKYKINCDKFMKFAHKQTAIDVTKRLPDRLFNEYGEAETNPEELSILDEKAYSMDTLPDIMYFSAPEKKSVLKGKVFLSPYIGISSMFIINTEKIFDDQVISKMDHRPKETSWNIGYKEWNASDSKLNKPLEMVHMTHNIPQVKDVLTGSSTGYIHVVDISKVKDKLSLFTTNDPNREVIYRGDEPLPIKEVIPHTCKWELKYSAQREKMFGKGYIESTYMEADGETDDPNTKQEDQNQQQPQTILQQVQQNVSQPAQQQNVTQQVQSTMTPPQEEATPPVLPTEEQSPVEETPVEEPSIEDTPVEDVPVEEPTPEPAPLPEPKPQSMPQKTDVAESDKNGVRRKKLYIAFIEWAKEYNTKNTFGSIFDKDAFHVTYPFVPDEMRYFYRLANPILCVLAGDLTFFQVSELRKLNGNNQKLNEMLIFAATPNDMRVFNSKDKMVYRAEEESGQIVLKDKLGDTFDEYIQMMIQKGDILNGPIEDEQPPAIE